MPRSPGGPGRGPAGGVRLGPEGSAKRAGVPVSVRARAGHSIAPARVR